MTGPDTTAPAAQGQRFRVVAGGIEHWLEVRPVGAEYRVFEPLSNTEMLDVKGVRATLFPHPLERALARTYARVAVVRYVCAIGPREFNERQARLAVRQLQLALL